MRQGMAHAHRPPLEIDPYRLTQLETGRALRTVISLQLNAQRLHDVLQLDRTRGRLGQHRCKEHEVLPVDKRDTQPLPLSRTFEPASERDARKAPANYNDACQRAHLRRAQMSSPLIATATRSPKAITPCSPARFDSAPISGI